VSTPQPPVIAIDGPSASGKGTLARLVARRLGFHYLDSGMLYRVLALAALESGTGLSDEAALAALAGALDLRVSDDDVYLGEELVSHALRSEQAGAAASEIAALRDVRTALLARQRGFRQPPGLVAEGRDMGSVVFPDARLKIYLTADVTERAQRRYKQLIEKGLGANMAVLLRGMQARDERDSARSVAPLQKSGDASELDTTRLSVEAAVDEILARYAAATAKRVS
jgi:cytidylate kinase